MWLVFDLAVRPQDHLVRLRDERIRDDRQRVVVHLHRLGAVGRGAARLGEHRRHFLVLEQHLADRQDHLLVETVECRQPAEAGGFESLPVITAFTPGTFSASEMSMFMISACGYGAAHQGHVQHPRQHEVVNVVAFALDEARILLALHRLAERSLRSSARCSSPRPRGHFRRRPAAAWRRPPAAPP